MKKPQHDILTLLTPQGAKTYLQRQRRRLFERKDVPAIRSVNIWAIRVGRRGRRQTFVSFYDMTAGRKWKRVVGLASNDGGRLDEHRLLEALYRESQRLRNFCVPKPYFYDPNYGISFIEYVPGTSLFDVIGKHKRIPTPTLRSIIRWLKALQTIDYHRLPLPVSRPNFRYVKRDLKIAEREMPQFSAKLNRVWGHWERWFTRTWPTLPLVSAHGDFHASNIKVLPGTNRVCVMDFGRMSPAPRFWDLAGFLSHLETLNGRNLPPHVIAPIKRDVLRMWKNEIGPLTKHDLEEITRLKTYFDIMAITFFIAWDEPWKLYRHIEYLYKKL